MTLDRTELLTLRAIDGLATADELAELVAAGVDLAPWLAASEAAREVLCPGQTPELADAVMARIGHPGVSQLIRAALLEDLGDESTLDRVEGVLEALDSDDGTGRVQAVLQAAHRKAMESAPDVSGAVMAELGLDAPASLGDLLREEAGPAPDLWPAIAGEIGVEDTGVNTPDATAPRPDAEVIRFEQRWAFPAVGMAAAAALLLFFGGTTPPVSDESLAFELSPVNHVEIEELTSFEGAMVQVMQLDEHAPTIIFISELEDPGPTDLDGEEGTTL